MNGLDWNETSIRFMLDADAIYGRGFYTSLAEAVLRHVPRGSRICDAGCGTAGLARAIAEFDAAALIDAVDISALAISSVRDVPSNVRMLCADIFSLPESVAYDVAVFCRFGKTEQALEFAVRHGVERLVLVRRNCFEHSFALARRERRNSFEETCRELSARRLDYCAETLELRFDQPIRDEEDAMEFFKLYGGCELRRDAVLDRLTASGDPQFPFAVRGDRPLGIITVKTEGGNV